MKFVFTAFIILTCQTLAFSQEAKKIKARGEYSTLFETNNKELFEIKCIELARINAIENTFGKIIMQGNSTYIQNSSNNAKKESYNSFNFISDTYVNGEWLSDIEKPKIVYESINEENEKSKIWIKVTVYGYVSEIVSTPVNFNFSPLSCDNNINCKTEEFKEKQDVFFYFQAPMSGYLSIYLDVPTENKTYKIFPYKRSKNSSNLKIEQDIEYILFSKKKNILKEPVDEIIPYLSKANTPEVNKLFVLFSPDQEIVKPVLSTNRPNQKFELPDSINSGEFQKWIQTLKSFNKTVQISTTYITINP